MIEDVLGVIQGCLRGEERSWDILFIEFSSMAENILCRFSDFGRDARDDVIQNVFIKLYRGGLSHFRGKTKYEFFNYFKTIVKNEAITYANARRTDGNPVAVAGDDPDCARLEDRIPDTATGSRPDRMAESKEEFDLIRGIIGTLSVEDQEIFFMKIQGYKDEEIGKLLNIPQGTVASRYSRMKEKVMEKLGEE